MEMDDNKFKEFLQKELDKEADKIMEKVDKDPDLDGVVAPEVIRERLFQQIHELEGEPEDEELENEEPENEEPRLTEEEPKLSPKEPELSPEDQELIRLGKLYKKNRSKGKIYLLGVAIVCVLALGITSFGGPKKVFSEMKRFLGGREQDVLNSGDGERHIERGTLTEEDAYEQIEEKFGFYPIKLVHLPEGMDFTELVIEEELQFAQLYYIDEEERSIAYRIIAKNRNGSVGIDVEDSLIQEYDKQIDGVTINIKEYLVEENESKRWSVNFTFRDAQYWILLMGVDEAEVEEIIENLYFS